ncbi:MAG TPA: hypothetical protein PLL10_09445 [Elusimicrobiales bacterium]|nr:hypothetical protein [Elusimicrobiales bacterium]
MIANMDLYLPLSGFLLSLVFFLYSLANYRESMAAAARSPQGVLDESAEAIEEISAEIAVFKHKLHEMHEVVASRKGLHEKQIGEIINGINSIVGRLEHADPQKVAELQPHIAKLVNELQELRTPAASTENSKQ